ncbi:hypothetical protein [Streptomyces xiamenensis]|uniref:hypothetical protein n=1 Tax=Streptomyces xiamenensis TaxID=408015 RepID=UPI0035D53BE5
MDATENPSTETREAAASTRELPSIRPVIEFALTFYYDGNAELAKLLVDKLVTEVRNS